MAIEVEIKVRVPDREGAIQTLEKFGGHFSICLVQEDTYYDTPQGRPSFKKTDEALRLRITHELKGLDFDPASREVLRTVPDITYKGPKLEEKTKTRRELRLEIDDAAVAKEMIPALGFVEVITLEKEREIYQLMWQDSHVEITFDRIQHLPGDYMELEIIANNEEDLIPARDKLLALLGNLGFTESDSIRESYLELVARELARG